MKLVRMCHMGSYYQRKVSVNHLFSSTIALIKLQTVSLLFKQVRKLNASTAVPKRFTSISNFLLEFLFAEMPQTSAEIPQVLVLLTLYLIRFLMQVRLIRGKLSTRLLHFRLLRSIQNFQLLLIHQKMVLRFGLKRGTSFEFLVV